MSTTVVMVYRFDAFELVCLNAYQTIDSLKVLFNCCHLTIPRFYDDLGVYNFLKPNSYETLNLHCSVFSAFYVRYYFFRVYPLIHLYQGLTANIDTSSSIQAFCHLQAVKSSSLRTISAMLE